MYGFFTSLQTDFDEAIERVTQALKSEGFGVLTSIDIQKAMKEKLDVDRLPYTILGACNPPLAHRALEADPDIGLLLPCNVIVRQEPDGRISVGFMDPAAVLSLVDNPAVGKLAADVRARLEQVKASLG